ncbi:WD40-repeat-containing domain protein [Chlamydoabsidia padenii]|nr:WD40-repeat-containing domain protein [Chlamydoabsidia padenii]
MDPFLQSTVAKNRQCFPTRSAPHLYPISDTNNTCNEFNTPEGVYRLEQKWLIPHIVPHFNTGTRVTLARNGRRPTMGSTLGLATTRSTTKSSGIQPSSTASSSISDIIYGLSSSSSLLEHTVSPPKSNNNGMNDKLTETPTLNIPITTNQSTSSDMIATSNNTSLLSDTLSTIPTVSIDSTTLTGNDKEMSNISLSTTISNTGSFSSIFSGHWRSHGDQHSTTPRPKNTLSKLKSSMIENIQTHSNLSKILANRQPDDCFLFYNIGACFLWMDTKIKDFLTCITFSRIIPTCHDINKTTSNNEHLDVVIGFNTGDCIWYDPLCHRYTRFNKHGIIHNAKVTDIKWVPGSDDLFMVSFDDGVVLVMDREREDQSSVTQPNKLSSDYEFITGKSTLKQNQYNPVSLWKVNRNGITAMEFSKDGSLVALVGSDGLLRIFDFAEERLYDVFSGYFGKLLCLAWSPDNKYILTGGQDDLITIWSLSEQCIVARCQGHKSWVTSLTFDTQRCDDKVYRFASVGEDCKLILWDFSTSMLHKPKKHKQMSLSCILPHRESSTKRSIQLSTTFHQDSNGGIHHVPNTTMDDGSNDDDDPVNNASISTVTHTSGRPESKQSRFLRRRRQSDDVQHVNNNSSSNYFEWTHTKKWPATIHPLINKSHVPFLQPLVAITAHGDPCTDVFFYSGGGSNDDDDLYNGDVDGDINIDIIVTSDRKGCVKKWCK